MLHLGTLRWEAHRRAAAGAGPGAEQYGGRLTPDLNVVVLGFVMDSSWDSTHYGILPKQELGSSLQVASPWESCFIIR